MFNILVHNLIHFIHTLDHVYGWNKSITLALYDRQLLLRARSHSPTPFDGFKKMRLGHN